MNPKNRALPSPGLGFVVRLQIFNSTAWERKRRMGWCSAGLEGPPGSAGDGGARDWGATDGGEECEEEEKNECVPAGGWDSLGEILQGAFCKTTSAQLNSGRREYYIYIVI
jgi:hypothetical protein